MRLPWDTHPDPSELSAHWFGRMLTALYFSTFMIRASFAIMLIAFPIYIISLKSYFLFGIVVSSSPIFELITVLFLGAYIDKHGRKNVLLLGLLGGAVALFLLLLSKDPVYLFIVNAFHGMSAAAILVSSLALIADYAPRESRGKIMGVFDFTNLFGWIVGFGIGGLLIDAFKDNIGMTFVIAGIMGLVAWFWATLNVTEPKREGKLGSAISFKAVASVLKQRSVILLIAPWFIIYLLVSTMLTFTSKAGTQELGLTGRDLAVLLGGGGTIFLITQFVYGWASDKYGRTKIMIVGTVGIVGIMLTVGGVFLSAPLTIAPAAHTAYASELDTDGSSEVILQSDAGVYLIGDNGTVISELAPPEGGFGRLGPAPSAAGHPVMTSYNDEGVELIDLTTVATLWVQEAHEPHAVRAGDVNVDGKPEVFFADRDGVHVGGEAVPAGALTLPALDGHLVVDARFAGATLHLLVANGPTTDLVTVTSGAPSTVSLGLNCTRLLAGDPARSGTVTVICGGSARIVAASNATVYDTFVFPEGAGVAALTSPSYLFIAHGPRGGSAMLFEPGSGTPALVDLPANQSAVTWTSENNEVAFFAYAPNGTLTNGVLSRGTSGWSVASSTGTVMVKRETAQATFSKLTSPELIVPLVLFGLMAGAFGPAALAGLTDVSQEDKRGTTMGLYSVVISTSMIVGPIATGFLVDNYGGFGVMMFLVSSAGAMALFMAIRALDVRRQGGEEHMLEAAKEKAEGTGPDPAPTDGDTGEE